MNITLRHGLLLLMLLPAVAGAAGSVYKWSDSQGLVHYDDQSRLAQRLTRSSIASNAVAAEPGATVPAELVAEVKRRCVDLRERAASMGAATQLYGRDPAGNSYRLSERQAALARADAERERARYCHPDAPRRFFRESIEQGRQQQRQAERQAAESLASIPVDGSPR